MEYPFERLKVWQKAMLLISEIYQVTKSFPQEERYGLTDQIRRSAVSITLNISEGSGRHHKKEYVQFLYLSRGSAYEVINLIKIGQNLRLITPAQAQSLLSLSDEVTAMLNGLINSLK